MLSQPLHSFYQYSMEMSKRLSFCSLGDIHVDPSDLMCAFSPVHTFLFSFTAVKVSSGYSIVLHSTLLNNLTLTSHLYFIGPTLLITCENIKVM